MSSHSWLRTDMSANRWQQTYFKNFVDISGDLYIRKGGISAGDNADKFTVNSNGDISANSVNIAGNLSVVSGVQIQADDTAIYVKSNDKNRLVLGYRVINGANNNTIVVHDGNVGIGGVWSPAYKLDVNGSIHGDSLNINNYFTVDGTGNISAASINGTLNTAAQPNITSVGTLSSLDVTNVVSAASVSATTFQGTGTTDTYFKGVTTNGTSPNTYFKSFRHLYLGSGASLNTIQILDSQKVGIRKTPANSFDVDINGKCRMDQSLSINTAAPSTDSGVVLDISGVSKFGRGGVTGHSEFTIQSVNNLTSLVFRTPDNSPDNFDNSELHFTSQSGTRMVIDTNGNVGIGTTSPTYTLDVSGDIDISGGMLVGKSDANYFKIQHKDHNTSGTIPEQIRLHNDGDVYITSTNALGKGIRFANGTTETMRITEGNVGIGTTAPSSNLQVNGNLSIYDNHRGFFIDSRTGDGFFDFFSTFLGQGVKRTGNKAFEAISDGNNAGLSAIMMERRNIRFYTNTYAGQASNLTLDHTELQAKERMVINNLGNVGIGTTNPLYKLDIYEDTTDTENSIRYSAKAPSGVDSKSYMRLERAGYGGAIGGGLKQGSGGVLALATINNDDTITDRMTIMRTGNVGIGTTNPSKKLDVVGDINFSGDLYQNGSLFSGGSSQWTTTGNNIYYNTGNVGIGTTTPTMLLHIHKGTGGGTLRLTSNNTSMYMGTNDNISGYIWVQSNDDLKIGTNNTEKMRILSNGNVGIGITSPASGYKLQVNGVIGANTFKRPTPGGAVFGSSTGNAALRSNGGNAYLDAIDGDIALRTTNLYTERMRITNVGRVGIGTTAPATVLDVNGNQTLAYPTLNNPTYSAFNHPNVVAKFRSNTTHSGLVIGVKNGNAPYIGDLNGTSGSHQSLGLDFIVNGHTRMNIATTGNVYIAGNQVTGSDSRIKNQINDVVFDDALQTFRSIETKTYKYKDRPYKGFVYGFIAQQIKEVIPYAVDEMSHNIPNIQNQATCILGPDNKYSKIVFTDFDTANLDASSNTLIVGANVEVTILEVIDNKTIRVDTDLSEWMGAVNASNQTVIPNEVQTYSQVILDASNNVVLENYDIEPIASMDASDASDNVVGKMADLTGDNTIDSSGNYVDASGNTIAAINADGHYIDASGNYFDADGNFKDASGSLIGTYKAEWKNVIIHGTSIFVYGQKVDDFHALNKDAIFTVATAALQEVDRQLQAEKAKTATLESQMADLLARVTALESA
jgi:hypothetical protein